MPSLQIPGRQAPVPSGCCPRYSATSSLSAAVFFSSTSTFQSDRSILRGLPTACSNAVGGLVLEGRRHPVTMKWPISIATAFRASSHDLHPLIRTRYRASLWLFHVLLVELLR